MPKDSDKNDDLILALNTQSQIYAEMVKEALENEGIEVLLKSVAGHHLRGMLPIKQDFFDYKLYIMREFANKAAEIVNTIVPKEEIL